MAISPFVRVGVPQGHPVPGVRLFEEKCHRSGKLNGFGVGQADRHLLELSAERRSGLENLPQFQLAKRDGRVGADARRECMPGVAVQPGGDIGGNHLGPCPPPAGNPADGFGVIALGGAVEAGAKQGIDHHIAGSDRRLRRRVCRRNPGRAQQREVAKRLALEPVEPTHHFDGDVPVVPLSAKDGEMPRRGGPLGRFIGESRPRIFHQYRSGSAGLVRRPLQSRHLLRGERELHRRSSSKTTAAATPASWVIERWTSAPRRCTSIRAWPES